MANLDQYYKRLNKPSQLQEHQHQIQRQSLVKDIFLSLLKYIKSSQLYHEQHEHSQRFMHQFLDLLQSFLEDNEVLTLEVTPEAFLYEGEEVISVQQSSARFIYGLYMEGVLGMSISQRASRQEIITLLGLISHDWQSDSDEDSADFITRAWRADFQNIHIDIADRFSDEEDMGDAAERADQLRGQSGGADILQLKGDSVLIPEIQRLMKELDAEARRSDEVVKMKQDEVSFFMSIQEEIRAIDEAGGDEDLLQQDLVASQQLEEEIAVIARGEDLPAEHTGQVLFELIRLENSAEKVELLGQQLGGHILYALEGEELELASGTLFPVLSLLDQDLFPGFRYRDAFRKGFSSTFGEQQLHRWKLLFKRATDRPALLPHLFTALSAMPVDVVPVFVELGMQYEDSLVIQQVLADIITLMGNGSPEALIELLVKTDREKSVVPLLALARIYAPLSVQPCLRCLSAETKEVREAALRALRRHDSSNVRTHVIQRLDDEADSVRQEALRYLAVYRDESMMEELELRMRRKQFGHRDERELRAWAMAYGIIGQSKAVPFLQELGMGTLKLSGPLLPQQLASVAGLNACRTARANRALRELGQEHEALRETIQSLNIRGVGGWR